MRAPCVREGAGFVGPRPAESRQIFRRAIGLRASRDILRSSRALRTYRRHLHRDKNSCGHRLSMPDRVFGKFVFVNPVAAHLVHAHEFRFERRHIFQTFKKVNLRPKVAAIRRRRLFAWINLNAPDFHAASFMALRRKTWSRRKYTNSARRISDSSDQNPNRQAGMKG
jgi:hypothetical protein